MQADIKQGLSVVQRLGNVVFVFFSIWTLIISAGLGAFSYTENFSYYQVTCKNVTSNETKIFESKNYISDYGSPDPEYWGKCLAIYSADLTNSIKESYQMESLDVATYKKFLEDGIVLNGYNDDIKNQIRADYSFSPKVNYSVETKFNIPLTVLCGLTGLLLGLILVYLAYKILVYVFYGERFFSKDRFLRILIRK